MKIFIDEGHNYSGADTGATGNGIREQDVTYNVGKELGSLFEGVGIATKHSRNKITDNVGKTLNESLYGRYSSANDWNADYFISLHCDSFKNIQAKGSHICVYSKCGVAEELANKINSHLLPLGLEGRSSHIVVRPDLAVLSKTKMTAILIEMGFISNPDNAKLQRDKYKDIAKAIFEGVCEHLNIKANDTADKHTTIKKEVGTTMTTLPTPAKHSLIGITHVIEVDPRNIWAVETQCSTKKVGYNNFVNSVFFMSQANGICYPQGIMVNGGQVICNNATHGKPVATLIVHDANNVELKYVSDITKEKDVWFAVSGYGIYPNITATQEGFKGKFSDVLRATNRPIIGYRKKDNKIVIAVRSNSSAQRANETAKNLGLDFAISLDGGGSTTLKVNGKYKFKGDGRKIFGGLIWA